MDQIRKISTELNITSNQVTAVVVLLDEGATVPFISRYRKERTGSLDEVYITKIRDRIQQLRDLDARRKVILDTIREQEKLTPILEKQINQADTMAALEDLYLPYRQKRKTKASIAREKGLAPLAEQILLQGNTVPEKLAAAFVSNSKSVGSVEEALEGARHIIAEMINEDQEVRQKIRKLFMREAMIRSKVIKAKSSVGEKFKDYFDWEEKLSAIPSHRMLAIRRGEKELILSVDISPNEDDALQLLYRQFVKGPGACSSQVELAAKDAYKRLLKPSMETEVRLNAKKAADQEAISVFAENLRQLLLSAPLGRKRTMGVDPGFRTGCKVVCLDRQGQLIANTTIYPNPPQNETAKAAATIQKLVSQHQIEAVAIGNGTANRETEQFFEQLRLPKEILITQVSESGASIYSASQVAREEFPDHDLTVRGAVSIGRRLMDPLAELVKIDAKSIGVGQYQHDVEQNLLKQSLDDVVMGCVNAVGVELNTASKELLSYVSGLGPSLAENIISYRNEHGPFQDRKSLKKVPRLGDKAFEQAAGFLRINGGKNVLDGSAVHPERYETVAQMAGDLGATVENLIIDGSLRTRVDLKRYMSEDLGLPTLRDIISELDKPGRDPREQFEPFRFDDSVHSMEDLVQGMRLPGIITNITKFGAFVDIGVHQDGLVHISHLTDQYVSDPAKVVKLQQKVNVTVMEVDIARKRIGLSMKSDPFGSNAPQKEKPSSQPAREDMAEKLSKLKRHLGNH